MTVTNSLPLMTPERDSCVEARGVTQPRKFIHIGFEAFWRLGEFLSGEDKIRFFLQVCGHLRDIGMTQKLLNKKATLTPIPGLQQALRDRAITFYNQEDPELFKFRTGFLHDMLYRDLRDFGYMGDGPAFLKRIGHDLGKQELRRGCLRTLLESRPVCVVEQNNFFQGILQLLGNFFKGSPHQSNFRLLGAFFKDGSGSCKGLKEFLDICANSNIQNRESALLNLICTKTIPFDMAMVIAEEAITDGAKGNALGAIAEHFKGVIDGKRLDQMLAIVQGMTNDGTKSDVLIAIAEHLNGVIDGAKLDKMLAIVQGMTADGAKSDVLIEIAEHCHGVIDGERLDQMFAIVVQGMTNDWCKSATLRWIATHCHGVIDGERLDQMLAIVRGMTNDLVKSDVLVAIAEHCHGVIDGERLDQMLAIVRGMTNDWYKSDTLRWIATGCHGVID